MQLGWPQLVDSLDNLDLSRIGQDNLRFAAIVNEGAGDQDLFTFQFFHHRKLREVRVSQDGRERRAVIWVKVQNEHVPVALLKDITHRAFESAFLSNLFVSPGEVVGVERGSV